MGTFFEIGKHDWRQAEAELRSKWRLPSSSSLVNTPVEPLGSGSTVTPAFSNLLCSRFASCFDAGRLSFDNARLQARECTLRASADDQHGKVDAPDAVHLRAG